MEAATKDRTTEPVNPGRNLYSDLQPGDGFVLNGRAVRVVDPPRVSPEWRVLVEDIEPRRYDIAWHLGQPVVRRLPVAERDPLREALEAIVRHADMPGGESWEQAYIEVADIARSALSPESNPETGR